MYDEQRLPSGDDLISDIERFLRDQGSQGPGPAVLTPGALHPGPNQAQDGPQAGPLAVEQDTGRVDPGGEPEGGTDEQHEQRDGDDDLPRRGHARSRSGRAS